MRRELMTSRRYVSTLSVALAYIVVLTQTASAKEIDLAAMLREQAATSNAAKEIEATNEACRKLPIFGGKNCKADIPHTPVDFHAYVTPYSCIDGWPRSFRRLLCSSVRFNPSGHCPETLSRCIPTPEWKTHRAVGCCTGLPC